MATEASVAHTVVADLHDAAEAGALLDTAGLLTTAGTDWSHHHRGCRRRLDRKVFIDETRSF